MPNKAKKAQRREAKVQMFAGAPMQPGINVIAAYSQGGDLLVVSTSEFKGTKGLDFRRYFRGQANGEEVWLPTGKGCRFNADKASELIATLSAMRSKITEALS